MIGDSDHRAFASAHGNTTLHYDSSSHTEVVATFHYLDTTAPPTFLGSRTQHEDRTERPIIVK
eukprot:3442224-Rhodomonas_salina.1